MVSAARLQFPQCRPTSASGSSSTFGTQQGIQNLTDAEARLSSARIAKTHQRICSKISSPAISTLDLFIQVMTDAQAKASHSTLFDLTKVWPKGDFPLIEVGYFELNRSRKRLRRSRTGAFSPAKHRPGISLFPTRCCRRDFLL